MAIAGGEGYANAPGTGWLAKNIGEMRAERDVARRERNEAFISAAAWKVRAVDAEARTAKLEKAMETIHMRLEPGEGWGPDECSIIISVARDALASEPKAECYPPTPILGLEDKSPNIPTDEPKAEEPKETT